MLKVAAIASTLQTSFARADHQQLHTSVVADRMAQERLAAARADGEAQQQVNERKPKLSKRGGRPNRSATVHGGLSS